MTARNHSRHIALAVTLVAAVASIQVLAFGRTFGNWHYLSEVVPALAYAGERARDLQVPEWWGGVGLGVPFAGNPDHPVLYPASWTLGFLPDLAGIDLWMVLHLALLGVGVAFLSRRLGAGDAQVIVAGGAASASGPATAALSGGTLWALAWSPWALLAASFIGQAESRRSRGRAAAGLSAAMAAQLFAGSFVHAPATAFAAVVVAAAAAGPGDRVRSALWSLAGLLGAALLAAAVLVPWLYLELAPSPAAAPAGLSPLVGAVWDSGTFYVGPALLVLALWAAGRRELWPVLATAALLIAAGAVNAAAHLPVGLLLIIALAGVGLTELWQQPPMVAVAAAAGAGLSLLAVGAILEGDLVTGVAVAAVAIMLAAWSVIPDRVGGLQPLLGAVVVGHLIAVSWHDLPRIERDQVASVPFLLETAIAEPSVPPPRFARPPLTGDPHPGDPEAIDRLHRTAAANVATRFGLQYVRGHDRAISDRLRETWLASGLASSRFLQLYAVDLLAVPQTVVEPAGLPTVGFDPRTDSSLVAIDGGRPRAFVAARWRWSADDRDTREAMFPEALGGPRGVPLATVHLAGAGNDGGLDRASPARPCVILEYRPERVRLDCSAGAAGYAVLLDSYTPGWSAEVEGEPRTIERADLLARAVPIGEGERRVVFHYRTPGLRQGALVSGLAWLNLIVLLLVLRRR